MYMKEKSRNSWIYEIFMALFAELLRKTHFAIVWWYFYFSLIFMMYCKIFFLLGKKNLKNEKNYKIFKIYIDV